MKHGSEYAKQVKRLFQRMTRKHGKPAPAEPTEPLEQLLVAILADCSTISKARAVYQKLSQQMVDLNELRVTPATELATLIGSSVPLAGAKARQMVDALNDVRRRQESMDLSFLHQRGRREAREYLESLDGVSPSVAARVVLFSLGGHAIPIDDLTRYILRKDEIIEESATAVEVQGFLERHIPAANTRAFVELLDKHVASKATRVEVEKLPELLNPPPPEPKPEPKKKAADKAKPAKKKSSPRKTPAKKAKKKPATGKSTKAARPGQSKAKTKKKKKKTSARTKKPSGAKGKGGKSKPGKKK